MTNGEIPEIAGLAAGQGLIRIPPGTDVPITPRVRRLIDSAPFQRLTRISQLGLVSLVYPAAHHSRFEHSLGVYRTALLYLQQLFRDDRFAALISSQDAELFVVAALLHDVGHWPFCHPIEDIRIAGIPRHEASAAQYIEQGEIADLLSQDWHIRPPDVTRLLRGDVVTPAETILASLLSGPIDVDKMDYLDRDSLHAGVPYGRNFDQARLIASLCLNEQGTALAISDKGRTAAELMVFARYVMFSEVYWHHTVRSATAMLQRAVFYLRDRLDYDALFQRTEPEFIVSLTEQSQGSPAESLVQRLFGPRRDLFKRWAQYSLFQEPALYERLARRPYPWLVRCSEALAEQLQQQTGIAIRGDQILIDAPPVKREVEIDIQVYFAKEHQYRLLGEVSPVVQTLAERQFDDYVKRVRVFVAAEVLSQLNPPPDVSPLLNTAIDSVAE